MRSPPVRSMTGTSLALRGSVTALPTPFTNGALDAACLAALCERQVDRGTTALVACGSTGEAGALTAQEYADAVRVAVMAAAGRVPVLAGCCALSTAAAAEMGRAAALAGATGLLCAPPPYCKPAQAGILAHLQAISDAAGLPILLYDVPGRTGVAVADATVARAFEQGLVSGLKDAAGDLSRPARLRAMCGDGLVQLTGDDATVAGYLGMGGHGCVSVAANLFPAVSARLHAAWQASDLATAATMRDLLAPVAQALFVEANPIPLKAGLELLGLARAEVRLPLMAATHATRAALTDALVAVCSMEEALAARSRYAIAS